MGYIGTYKKAYTFIFLIRWTEFIFKLFVLFHNMNFQIKKRENKLVLFDTGPKILNCELEIRDAYLVVSQEIQLHS